MMRVVPQRNDACRSIKFWNQTIIPASFVEEDSLAHAPLSWHAGLEPAVAA